MGCPQCHSDEISPAGVCLICGYQVAAEASEPKSDGGEKDVPGHSGLIEMNYSGTAGETPERNEVPQWRQQLSQRLHEIRQKKEASAAQQESNVSPAAVPQANAAESLSSLQARLKKVPVRKPPVPAIPPPRQKTLQPLEPEPAPKVVSPPPSPVTDSQEIRNLIDNAVSRQSSQSAVPPGTVRPVITGQPGPALDEDGKLILLTRTLSGLVDLIVVIFCTGVFIVAADYFSGIIALDHISLMLFFLVFLMNFFLYSLFFLSASNQTIGMMITDLRIVGADEKRPSFGRVLGRCCVFLVSLFCAGSGLLSGLFDRNSLCFHDRVSGTRVVRI